MCGVPPVGAIVKREGQAAQATCHGRLDDIATWAVLCFVPVDDSLPGQLNM